MKYVLKVPVLVVNRQSYLTTIMERIIPIADQFPDETTVKMYGDSWNQISNYSLNWSTTLYSIRELYKCISVYFGMSEQYGESENNSIRIIASVQFNRLNQDAIDMIKEIESDVSNIYLNKPKGMSDELQQELLDIISGTTSILAPEAEINDDFISTILEGASKWNLLQRADSDYDTRTNTSRMQTDRITEPTNATHTIYTYENSDISKYQIMYDKLDAELNRHILNEVPKGHPDRKEWSKKTNKLRAHRRYYNNKLTSPP